MCIKQLAQLVDGCWRALIVCVSVCFMAATGSVAGPVAITGLELISAVVAHNKRLTLQAKTLSL